MSSAANNLELIEKNFHNLILDQCKFCKFNEYLVNHPDFEMPKITTGLLGWENGVHITIPGLFGGFDYFLDSINNELILYAEQSSRMDHSREDYLDFAVTAERYKLLENEEREKVWQKFRQLDRKRLEEYKQRIPEKHNCKSSEQNSITFNKLSIS